MLRFMCAACGGMCYMCRGEVLMKDLYLCRWWRLYGLDIDMPADRQGHSCSWTHMHEKTPYSPRQINMQNMLPVSTGKPKIKVATLSSIHYWKSTENHCVFMIFHHLPFHFLPQNSFFASLEGFLFCLLAGALSAREKNKLEPNSEQYAHLNLLYDYV